MIVLSQYCGQLGLRVFHSVTFINDHVNPSDLAQDRTILNDILKGGQKHLEIAISDFLLQRSARIGRTFVNNGRHRWSPFFKFQGPVSQSPEM
jgi:hypothetical protein